MNRKELIKLKSEIIDKIINTDMTIEICEKFNDKEEVKRLKEHKKYLERRLRDIIRRLENE